MGHYQANEHSNHGGSKREETEKAHKIILIIAEYFTNYSEKWTSQYRKLTGLLARSA